KTIEVAFAGKTGLSRTKIREMMDAETWMTAKEAHELGFVDEITGDLKMAAHFDLTKFKNPPAPLTPPREQMDSKLTEAEKTFLQKLIAFFSKPEIVLDPKDTKIVELEAKIVLSDEATEELTTAHATASIEKDNQLSE